MAVARDRHVETPEIKISIRNSGSNELGTIFVLRVNTNKTDAYNFGSYKTTAPLCHGTNAKRFQLATTNVKTYNKVLIHRNGVFIIIHRDIKSQSEMFKLYSTRLNYDMLGKKLLKFYSDSSGVFFRFIPSLFRGPLQLPRHRSSSPFCVPDFVESILSLSSWQLLLSRFWVYRVRRINHSHSYSNVLTVTTKQQLSVIIVR